jgi:enoyl-CoA hydratase
LRLAGHPAQAGGGIREPTNRLGTAMIDVERRDQIAILTLAHGKANAMDLEFCDALAERLERLAEDEARAVVVTGRGAIFSAGVDLLRLLNEGPEYARRFVPALERMCDALLRFPKPLVAAVNGHAIAGGCIVACASDRRLMARGKGRIGVPELRVGVPFPDVALEVLRSSLATDVLRDLVWTGATLDVEEAVRRGLIDEIVEPDELIARAISTASFLAEPGPEVIRITKSQLRAPVIARLDAMRATESETGELWSSPAIMDAIRRYVDRTFRRSTS